MIRHNLIGPRVQWELCMKFEKKFIQVSLPHTVRQTNIEFFWDVKIKTTTKIKNNRPAIIVKMP